MTDNKANLYCTAILFGGPLDGEEINVPVIQDDNHKTLVPTLMAIQEVTNSSITNMKYKIRSTNTEECVDAKDRIMYDFTESTSVI